MVQAETAPPPARGRGRPDGLTTLLLKLRRGAELLSAALFAAMFIAFVLQVVSRYVFDDPISWTLEVCSITYVWIVFFATGTIVTMRQHITFDMLYSSLSPRWKRGFAIFTTGSLLVIFVVCLPAVLDYIRFVSHKHTPILIIRLDIIYSCFGIFMIGAIVGSAIRLYRLLGRDWRNSI
jgi:TRAP-type C4-dicarboxylate transport system permease small subunit